MTQKEAKEIVKEVFGDLEIEFDEDNLWRGFDVSFGKTFDEYEEAEQFIEALKTLCK